MSKAHEYQRTHMQRIQIARVKQHVIWIWAQLHWHWAKGRTPQGPGSPFLQMN